MVWERAVVGIDGAGGLEAGSEVKATLLGKNVVIETGAIVEAGVVIGDGTLVEGLARIGEGSVIGNVSLHKLFQARWLMRLEEIIC